MQRKRFLTLNKKIYCIVRAKPSDAWLAFLFTCHTCYLFGHKCQATPPPCYSQHSRPTQGRNLGSRPETFW